MRASGRQGRLGKSWENEVGPRLAQRGCRLHRVDAQPLLSGRTGFTSCLSHAC